MIKYIAKLGSDLDTPVKLLVKCESNALPIPNMVTYYHPVNSLVKFKLNALSKPHKIVAVKRTCNFIQNHLLFFQNSYGSRISGSQVSCPCTSQMLCYGSQTDQK